MDSTCGGCKEGYKMLEEEEEVGEGQFVMKNVACYENLCGTDCNGHGTCKFEPLRSAFTC